MQDFPYSDLKEILDRESARINSADFIAADPVQFPRMFDDTRDIELAALLCSTIAWGNRKMICRNCTKMLGMMDHSPYRYMMDKGYEELDDETNIHRTFFNRNFKHYMRGLREIYARHGSLQEFARAERIAESEFPSWQLAAAINRELCEANDGISDSRCLPQNMDNSALKRLNMALRWLVRNDGIVDMGVWDVIKPSQLYIPLDVHVGNVARSFGMLTRNANDRRSAVELTETLRRFDPSDPVKYDYALFGLGVEAKSAGKE